MVQLFKIPLDLQSPRTPPLRWHWQDEHWMMHVGASTFFPAFYACDAFVDMSSYDWGEGKDQKWARVSAPCFVAGLLGKLAPCRGVQGELRPVT